MKNFYEMLEEIDPDDEKLLSSHDIYIVDKFVHNNYEMALIKQETGLWPIGLEYHLAISRKGMSPVTDVMTKNPIDMSFLTIGHTFFKFINKIKEWLNLYGDIVIASENVKKLNIWISFSKKFGLNVEIKTINLLMLGPTKIGIIKSA